REGHLVGAWADLEVEARAAGTLECLYLADEDAVHERARPVGSLRCRRGELGGTGAAGRATGAALVVEPVGQTEADEPVVACQLFGRQHLLHTLTSSGMATAVEPIEPGPAMPPDLMISASHRA